MIIHINFKLLINEDFTVILTNFCRKHLKNILKNSLKLTKLIKRRFKHSLSFQCSLRKWEKIRLLTSWRLPHSYNFTGQLIFIFNSYKASYRKWADRKIEKVLTMTDYLKQHV